MISPDTFFNIKQQMQQNIELAEKQLQALIVSQHEMKDINVLARSIREYENIEHMIENQAHVFSFFSSPVDSVLSPFVKMELLSYVLAARDVDSEIAKTTAAVVHQELSLMAQSEEDSDTTNIEEEYKEFILPAYLIAEQYAEIESLMRELIRFCQLRDQQYNEIHARDVLRYAVELTIDVSTSLDSLIVLIREGLGTWMSEADRVGLLDACEERLASLRFDEKKRENLAHEKAVLMLENREKHATI